MSIDTWGEWQPSKRPPKVERFNVTEEADKQHEELVAPAPVTMEWNLSVKQAAALLGIHPQSVYKLAREGRVETRRVLGAWRFNERQLVEWVNSGGAA